MVTAGGNRLPVTTLVTSYHSYETECSRSGRKGLGLTNPTLLEAAKRGGVTAERDGTYNLREGSASVRAKIVLEYEVVRA